jgi:hypothetical protein
MLPSEAKEKDYTACGGKQVVCGYDKAQNPVYCYQKPVTTATIESSAAIAAVPVQCPSACNNCLLPSEAKAKGYATLCGGKQVGCGYDQYQNQRYCYEKPGTTMATNTPTTQPLTKCPASCSCLLPAEATKADYTLCGGKQVVCAYDQNQNQKYCYQPGGTTSPTTMTTWAVTSLPTVTTMETTRAGPVVTQAARTDEITGSPTPTPVTSAVQVPLKVTPVGTAPLKGPPQETRRGGIGGVFEAIMGFFSSLFSGSTPPQSSPMERIPGGVYVNADRPEPGVAG